MTNVFFKLFALLIFALCSPILHSQDPLDSTVHIAVASNFTSTLKELADEFKKDSGYSLIISSAATGQLYAQIIQKAPYDIFLAADSKRPDSLQAKNLIIKNSRFTYALGQLALYIPNSTIVLDENSLSQQEINKLAIANPKVAPYGIAAMQYLQHLKLQEKYQDKLVFGQTITQTYQYVESRNADAGLVALSSLKQSWVNKNSYFVIPADTYQPLYHDAALLNQKISAQQFMHFLKSEKARMIIRKAGYKLE